LADQFGDVTALYNADYSDLRNRGIPNRMHKTLCDKSLTQAERIIEQCQRMDITVIPYNDYRYPDKLNNIHDPPAVLYVKGTLPDFQRLPGLAIVGTRKASDAGLYYTFDFAYHLAKAGVLIVSGMASGIDSAANRGALHAGRSTVAVLGCGVDVVYPSENRGLYDDIVTFGAVVSEYPPGTKPIGRHFPARNRIMSGLTDGVFVIEGLARSGAGITANCALEQGRMVFALPGRHDDPLAKKPNTLIKNHAKLVDCLDDILSEFPQFSFAHVPAETRKESVMQVRPYVKNDAPRKPAFISEPIMPPPLDLTAFSKPEQEILTVLASRTCTMEMLTAAVDMPVNELLTHITMLEMNGTITDTGGRTYKITGGTL
jgi:DNA processing protein